MSNEPIKPALTPEEWERCRVVRGEEWSAGGLVVAFGGDGVSIGHRGEGENFLIETVVGVDGPANRHTVAAACLEGHPDGFTWEDVTLLRGWAARDEVERRAILNPALHLPSPLWNLAERLAAILPPEGV